MSDVTIKQVVIPDGPYENNDPSDWATKMEGDGDGEWIATPNAVNTGDWQ